MSWVPVNGVVVPTLTATPQLYYQFHPMVLNCRHGAVTLKTGEIVVRIGRYGQLPRYAEPTRFPLAALRKIRVRRTWRGQTEMTIEGEHADGKGVRRRGTTCCSDCWPEQTVDALIRQFRRAQPDLLIEDLRPWRAALFACQFDGASSIDSMTGIEFEHYLENLFRSLRYEITRTKITGDFGADLILDRDEHKTVVQAKRSTRPVGLKAVQEAIGARHYYGADYAIVVTNRTFTPGAIDLAKASQVELWDRVRLVDRR